MSESVIRRRAVRQWTIDRALREDAARAEVERIDDDAVDAERAEQDGEAIARGRARLELARVAADPREEALDGVAAREHDAGEADARVVADRERRAVAALD